MSEENLAKDLNLDIDDFESEPGVIDSEYKPSRPKRQGSLGMGILVGSILTIILELGMGLALDVANNLVERYIAYMLGIFVIFVVAFFVRSVWKMIFVAMPVVIGVSFILPFFLPNYFSALMAPFLNLIPLVQGVLDNSGSLGINVADFQLYIDLISTYGIILDFLIAIFVAFFAGIGLTSIVKIVTQSPSILTIFTFLFGGVFFIIGVIILPYAVVIFTGVAQFGLSFGVGGLALQQGMTLSAAGDNQGAATYFNQATEWFEQADAMLQGLSDLGAFYFMSTAVPDLRPLLENGFIVIKAGVSVAKGLGPIIGGVLNIQSGIDESMSALNQTSTLQLSASNLDTFDAGIEKMKIGFKNFTSAVPLIKEAINTLLGLDEKGLINSAASNGLEGTINAEQISLIKGAANLLKVTLDAFEVLITDTDPNSDAIDAPFIHLLKGALSLDDASTAVGETTSFEGTDVVFGNAVSNFTIVVDAMEEPIFTDFENTDVGNNSQVVDMKKQLSGIFNFIHDAGNVAISVGNFGVTASPVITKLNQTISVFSDPQYDNFTVIPNTVYDEMKTNLTNIIPQSEFLTVTAANSELNVAKMEANIANSSYGMMNTQATSFVNNFKNFNLTENANNIYSINGGFIGLIETIQGLRGVNDRFDAMQSEIDVLNALDVSTYTLAVDTEVKYRLGNINGNVTLANNELDQVLPSINNAIGNFSKVTNMPQMTTTGTALTNIKADILDLQCVGTVPNADGLCQVAYLIQESVILQTPPSTIYTSLNALNNSTDGQMQYLTGKIDNINTELQTISIAG